MVVALRPLAPAAADRPALAVENMAELIVVGGAVGSVTQGGMGWGAAWEIGRRQSDATCTQGCCWEANAPPVAQVSSSQGSSAGGLLAPKSHRKFALATTTWVGGLLGDAIESSMAPPDPPSPAHTQ